MSNQDEVKEDIAVLDTITKVTVSFGFTIQPAQFESIKIEIGAEAEVHPACQTPDAVLKSLKKFVADKVMEEIPKRIEDWKETCQIRRR